MYINFSLKTVQPSPNLSTDANRRTDTEKKTYKDLSSSLGDLVKLLGFFLFTAMVILSASVKRVGDFRMRGSKKIIKGVRTDVHMDIVTTRLNWPQGLWAELVCGSQCPCVHPSACL